MQFLYQGQNQQIYKEQVYIDYSQLWIYLFVLLYISSISVYAQVSENDKKIGIPDSVKSDYEEWLRNEPKKSAQHDSSSIDPMLSRLPIINPKELSPKRPPVSVIIMTPKLRTDMQLAYQSHWLEEQRKSQKGGAMTAGDRDRKSVG